MPCAIGIATVIVAAVLAAALFFITPIGDCKAHRPVFDGELLAPGWGYTFREADAVLTGRVTQKLGSQPDLLLFRDAGEEPRVITTDYRIDVDRLWYPLTAPDQAIAVPVTEPNPEYGDGQSLVTLFHSADLVVGQRVLLFLGHIPPDRKAEQAGELGMGYPIPEGFSYRNYYSVMALWRYGLECATQPPG